MPRKPRSCRLSRAQPISFSPFGRSVAQVTAACRVVKHQTHESKLQRKCLPGSSEQAVEDENEKSESSDEEEFEGIVQADFAFFDPKPDDFHGVKVLLQTYLDDEQWDLSGFADLTVEQTTVGTVIKIENDEDNILYSVVSALNLGRYKDHKCLMEIKAFLIKVCPEKDILANLRSFFGEQAQEVGLLVYQRVVNLPPQLLPPLYDALFDEISWATKDEPTKELRQSFCFKFYLLISRIYKHKNVDRKKGPNCSSEEDVIYIKPEDELFHKLSSWSFSFPLGTQPVATRELKHYQLTGLVMAVEASKVSIFRQQLHSLIDE